MSRTISRSAEEVKEYPRSVRILHQVVRQVAPGEVKAVDGVGQGVALVDGHGVRDAVTAVEHDTGGATGGVQREDRLDGDVHGGDVEGLEHDLGHLLAVRLGVEGRLGEQHGVLLGGDAKLVVEGVVPDLLHVVPVGHDTVLDGVLQGEDAALALRLVADVRILLAHAHHHALVAGATHDGGEDRAGGVVAGETSLEGRKGATIGGGSVSSKDRGRAVTRETRASRRGSIGNHRRASVGRAFRMISRGRALAIAREGWKRDGDRARGDGR